MKAINIYTLTRIEDNNNLKRLERQLSGRNYFLNIKTWEIDCLREVADNLFDSINNIDLLKFYYSFQIPKLGKEFDLLRITDEYVINIELKSGDVSDDKVKRQLLRNRYYLSSLGKTIKSYTYISDANRLVRLTKSEKLADTDFAKLAEDIRNADGEYSASIDDLFKEEKYIISPLSDPERFLRRDYFLTSQQNDIKNNILKNVREKSYSFQGFTGLPGTGKTLLLYDIAMELSRRQKVCVLHFGSFPEELKTLDDRLKRIDFYNCQSDEGFDLSEYQAIFVDEGHRVSNEYIEFIENYSMSRKLPVIISYDSEDAISPDERINDSSLAIESLEGFIKYKLTNRIRMNQELSSFINCLMRPDKYRRRMGYPNIAVSFANDLKEVEVLLKSFIENKYVYVAVPYYANNIANEKIVIAADKATCREFEKVVMLIDDSFYYDEKYLRCNYLENDESGVRMLFHGLNRAKQKISLIVYNNEQVFKNILTILQGEVR